MKIRKPTKEIKKFDLEKMQVAKLKNMHLIKGGDGSGDTTIDSKSNQKTSSANCIEQDQ